ncbi:pentatricopeptide repeat-containing protein At3g09040, mitochondrial-like [Oryza brachyantha]|uniref:pentatricopeptide repeat-containing protein At3g09040, mitochondrial-like n=1 Tax=Oryza brachyantha TaxID=4533 RepID=UPI001ADA083E|nr:pentatricopeptide repeat-containing protein At3g09040, mitochondrial-like [Oryza brachyantha]
MFPPILLRRHLLLHSPRRLHLFITRALSIATNTTVGSHLHAQPIKLPMSMSATHISTMNHLLIFYSRRGLLHPALQLFDEMPHRNLVSWTVIISASERNGAPHLGLRLFVSMIRSGLCPNEFALATTLTACCHSMPHASNKLLFGLSLHGIAVKAGVDGNPFVGSSLLLMYAKHGHIVAAERAFLHIQNRDLTCWNAMLEGYVLNDFAHHAMRTMLLMHHSGLKADRFTYISVIKSCSISGERDFGRQLHGLVIQRMLNSDTSVMNSLVDMYFTAGQKEVAVAVFHKIQQKDTVSWNTMISGFAHDEDEQAAIRYLIDMSRSGCKPNQVTYSVLLRLTGAKENVSLGLQFFALAYRHGYTDNVLVANAAINMLSRCGLLNCAYGFFCGLTFRNIVTWNEMIAGYGLFGCSEDAISLFRSLVCFGPRPDEFTYSAVLSSFQEAQGARDHELIHTLILKQGFTSCQFVSTSLIKAYAAALGSVQSSQKIIEDAGKMDLVSWGVIISAFLKHGLNDEVLFFFNLFRGDSTNKPDEFILATVLNACANAALIRHCSCIHSLVLRTGHAKHFCVASAVVDAYAKCGEITSAEKAFNAVSSTSEDAILYNTMLTAYANHGLIQEALSLYEGMTKAQLNPTPATSVAILSACSHLGLVEQGKLVFSSMLSAHPARANYACLVDLLARKGLLDEAKNVIEAMPFQPWPAVWRSLVNGCRIHGNKQLGVVAAEKILRMAPSSDGAYVSLSNVYADDGEWQLAEETRRKMVQNQVQKVQGYSRIEI